MSDILQEIIAHKHDELTQMRAKKPSLRQALLDSESGIIAEFKRKSPSKGWIKEEGRPDLIPLSYQQNGAAALSILTDKKFFGGHDDFIRQARQSGVTIPVLYKNFVIDEFQLYEAALCGASAVLLIAACLSRSLCGNLIEKAHSIGLEVLLEMHSEPELARTSAASTIAISAPSSPMWRTPSAWPSACPRRLSRSARAASATLLPCVPCARLASVVSSLVRTS